MWRMCVFMEKWFGVIYLFSMSEDLIWVSVVNVMECNRSSSKCCCSFVGYIGFWVVGIYFVVCVRWIIFFGFLLVIVIGVGIVNLFLNIYLVVILWRMILVFKVFDIVICDCRKILENRIWKWWWMFICI